jgi:hypothetical protein
MLGVFPVTKRVKLTLYKLLSMFGADRTEKGYLTNPQLAQHSYRQEPVAVLASLRSSHPSAGMKQNTKI